MLGRYSQRGSLGDEGWRSRCHAELHAHVLLGSRAGMHFEGSLRRRRAAVSLSSFRMVFDVRGSPDHSRQRSTHMYGVAISGQQFLGTEAQFRLFDFKKRLSSLLLMWHRLVPSELGRHRPLTGSSLLPGMSSCLRPLCAVCRMHRVCSPNLKRLRRLHGAGAQNRKRRRG